MKKIFLLGLFIAFFIPCNACADGNEFRQADEVFQVIKIIRSRLEKVIPEVKKNETQIITKIDIKRAELLLAEEKAKKKNLDIAFAANDYRAFYNPLFKVKDLELQIESLTWAMETCNKISAHLEGWKNLMFLTESLYVKGFFKNSDELLDCLSSTNNQISKLEAWLSSYKYQNSLL